MTEYKESYFHKRKIPVGTYGDITKVLEECYEALDAKEQGQRFMFAIEVADIVGAVIGVCEKEDIDFEELVKFNILRRNVYERERLSNP